MAKKFHARSILRPEKTKEEERWEEEEEKRLDSKTKKAPTTVFDGINEDRAMRNSRTAIMQDISQEQRDDDDWCEERN